MKRFASLLLAALMLTTLLSVFAVPAFAEEQSVSYIDRSWDEQKNTVVTADATANATLVTPDMATWGIKDSDTPQWYAVTGTVDLTVRLEVLGDVRLILCDGCVLNAPKGITLEEGNSLTVHAQSDGDAMGKLMIKNYSQFTRKGYSAAAAAIGGRAGNNGQNIYEAGETGKSAGALCWKGGSLTVTAPEYVCIGGGDGGWGFGGIADAELNHPGAGGSGGKSADMSIYGGAINLDGAFGVSGGAGGIGGGSCGGRSNNGGNGGSGGTFTIYNGNVNIHSTTGVCIGGGNGGEGGNASRGTGVGGNGGNGGDGGSVIIKGGTVMMNSDADCFRAKPGAGGIKEDDIDEAHKNIAGRSGYGGKAVALTVNSCATVMTGADETTAKTISVSSTLTTDSNDETFKDKTYCKFFFPLGSVKYTYADGLATFNGSGEIPEGFFCDNKDIQKVVIEDGITAISPEAFSGCTNLKEVIFKDNCKIGENAFMGVPSVKLLVPFTCLQDCKGNYGAEKVTVEVNSKITTPISVGSIKYTFVDGLLTFNGSGEISTEVFKERPEIQRIVIEDGITSIAAETFSGCTNLKEVLIKGDCKIGENAFKDVPSVEVLVPFAHFKDYKDKYSTENVTVGIYCGDGLKADLQNGKLTISGKGSICDNAFSGSSNEFNSVVIKEGVTGIGENAFYSCLSLASVTIPSSVTNIGDKAFSMSKEISKFTVKANTPPTVNNKDALPYYSDSLAIYVPYGMSGAYKKATGWSSYFRKTYEAYTVVDKLTEHGSITVSQDCFPTSDYNEADKTVTVTATPDEGYRLKSLVWNNGTKDENITGKMSFRMPSDNVTVTAVFEKVQDDATGLTLSDGNWWIIAAGAVVIVGGVVAIIVASKKRKKPAVADGAEITDDTEKTEE